MVRNNDITKVDKLYKELRKDIINCRYELNELINEKVIAEKYGVSKTPAREALAKLVLEGYLVKYPRVGYYVKEIKLKEYYQIVQLRFILESGIIRYILSNVSDEKIETLNKYVSDTCVKYEDYYQANMAFHLAMAGLIENQYIYDALKHVFEINTRNISKAYYNKMNGDIHKNHRELIEMLKERNEEGSINILREELHRSDDNVNWF